MSTLGPSHTWLAYWLDASDEKLPQGDAKTLRALLATHGVSAKGTRLYFEYGDPLYEPLGSVWIQPHNRDHSRASALAWLKLLQACEMDIAPPPAFARAIAECGRPEDGLESIPVALFRAA